jgi:hypothetical protein
MHVSMYVFMMIYVGIWQDMLHRESARTRTRARKRARERGRGREGEREREREGEARGAEMGSRVLRLPIVHHCPDWHLGLVVRAATQ